MDCRRASDPGDAMIWIVADADDASARAVIDALHACDARALSITPRRLLGGGVRHALAAGGAVETWLRTGAAWTRLRPAAVWFRATPTYPAVFELAAPGDREYAQAETTALLASWLRACGDVVVNAADGGSLCGPCWSRSRWLMSAQRLGLAVAPHAAATSARLLAGWRGTPYDARRPAALPATNADVELLVAGRRVIGAEAERVEPGCLALAAAAGCRYLRLGFVRAGSELRLAWADPNAAIGDPLEARAMAACLLELARASERAALRA